jgi:uncharacterized protein (TIGR02452 family)
MSRNQRAEIAAETVRILKNKTYTLGESTISIAAEMDACLAGTEVIGLEDWASIETEAQEKIKLRPQGKPVDIHLFAETTFRTCSRWVADQGLSHVACLNFASAKNPGGGFLGGSQAQEEALSRASGLYASLLKQQEYYEFNRKTGTCLYSDYMIWSPEVPVFRDDHDVLLPRPYTTSIITAPAVNAGCIRQNERQKDDQILPVMIRRTEKLLALAVVKGVENLVLGAWGCGVFGNDPATIAGIFGSLLRPGGAFQHAFTQAAFSIPSGGNSQANWKAFQNI